MNLERRQQILRVSGAALRAVDPMEAVRAQVVRSGNTLQVGPHEYRLDEIDRIVVVGGGKAGAPMATAIAEVLGATVTGGSVNVKHGHTAGAGVWHVGFGKGGDETPRQTSAFTGRISLVEAGHPVPDEHGLAGAETIAGLLHGLTERDLVIVLISGGGSALLPRPVPGVTLTDLQQLTGIMLKCGANITELNCLRKHLSQLQGGQLARMAAPARVATLILSDVVGSPLDVIGSGPTVPDRSSFADAMNVLRSYGVVESVPASILADLQRGAAGQIADTPKPGDPLFSRVTNVVVGDNAIAARAAVAEARRQGWQAQLLTTYVEGEAREVARLMAGLAHGIACGPSDLKPPVCLVFGGETTVTIRGDGLGGRNQELALAAAIALDGYAPLPNGVEVAVVSLATDGSDGPTDAAGGIATRDTLARGRALGLDAHAALANNDSYHYLSALGDLIVTGPTNTNVNDLIFVLALK